jgi:hypothetical protein
MIRVKTTQIQGMSNHPTHIRDSMRNQHFCTIPMPHPLERHQGETHIQDSSKRQDDCNPWKAGLPKKKPKDSRQEQRPSHQKQHTGKTGTQIATRLFPY